MAISTVAGPLLIEPPGYNYMGKRDCENRTPYIADNLDIMRGMNSATVDLIYLDPPFNSNQNYAAPIGSVAAGTAFVDTWSLDDVKREWVEQEADRAWQSAMQEPIQAGAEDRGVIAFWLG